MLPPYSTTHRGERPSRSYAGCNSPPRSRCRGSPSTGFSTCHRPHLLRLPEGDGSRLLQPNGGGVPPVGGGLHGVLRTPDGREASPAESRPVRGRLSVLLRHQAGRAVRPGAPDKGDRTGEDAWSLRVRRRPPRARSGCSGRRR